MSILLREGFGNLSNGTHTAGTTKEILGEQWSTFATNITFEDIGDGRKWFSPVSTGYPGLASGTVLGSVTELAVGFRVYRASTADVAIVLFRNSSAQDVMSIGINSSGQVCIGIADTSGNHGSCVIQSAQSVGSIPTGSASYVEVRVTAHKSTGTAKFYINGVLDSERTDIATVRSGASDVDYNSFRIGHDNRGAGWWAFPNTWKVTDLVFHTDASPIGDVGVYYKPVDGDEGTPDFTPSAVGANTLMLDEIGPDEDTTHNESDGTAGHRDQFSAAGLTGLTILEVCTLVRARKTDTGTATLLLGMKENLTEDQSAAKALSEDYLTLLEGWATNPDTSAAWTAQQAIDALISYEVGA